MRDLPVPLVVDDEKSVDRLDSRIDATLLQRLFRAYVRFAKAVGTVGADEERIVRGAVSADRDRLLEHERAHLVDVAPRHPEGIGDAQRPRVEQMDDRDFDNGKDRRECERAQNDGKTTTVH